MANMHLDLLVHVLQNYHKSSTHFSSTFRFQIEQFVSCSTSTSACLSFLQLPHHIDYLLTYLMWQPGCSNFASVCTAELIDGALFEFYNV